MRTAAPENLITGETGAWEIVIGIEAHAQISSRAKLFSEAGTAFGLQPNMQVSFLDAAMPGMLPVVNRVCVEQAVRAALGLGARINLRSIFERKNYFYPDLPQGYQISQYALPLAEGGALPIDLPEGQAEIGIERLHIEQDAGKSLHEGEGASLVDLNRAGIALMEIVSRPDMRSAAGAQAYMRKLRTLLRYLEVCDGNMEQGSLRADLNVSVRRPGEEMGTRCEIKNVNSIRFIGQAANYEARRQIALIESGGKVLQQTRLFDPARGATRTMRSKEEAHDYRYFPDPDLPPLVVTSQKVEALAAGLPELPDAKKKRFIESYGLPAYDASVLTAARAHADFFEQAAQGHDPKAVANWMLGDFFGALNKAGLDISEQKIAPQQLGSLCALIAEGIISGRIAKQVFEIMFKTGQDPAQIVEEKGWRQVSDEGAIDSLVEQVLAAHPDKAQLARNKPQLLGWFVGQAMKSSSGKANPASVNKVLRKKLDL